MCVCIGNQKWLFIIRITGLNVGIKAIVRYINIIKDKHTNTL